MHGFALRLGQPLYPHMKLIVEPAPAPSTMLLLRVDAHDRHLHATPGSPDESWLASIRTSNKELGEPHRGRLVQRTASPPSRTFSAPNSPHAKPNAARVTAADPPRLFISPPATSGKY